MSDTPRTDALKIPSEAMLLIGQEGVPKKIVEGILILGAHARTLERELSVAREAAAFAGLVLAESRDSLADLDGGWIQDTAVACGMLEAVEVTEACNPDNCMCAECGDFPATCYRYTQSAQAALDAARKERA